MIISENDRLDLRRAFEDLFGDKRLAAITMEAIPPLNYYQFATKDDLRAATSELRGEVAELRGAIHTELARVRTEGANNLRLMLASQFGTAALIMGWVSAAT